MTPEHREWVAREASEFIRSAFARMHPDDAREFAGLCAVDEGHELFTPERALEYVRGLSADAKISLAKELATSGMRQKESAP